MTVGAALSRPRQRQGLCNPKAGITVTEPFERDWIADAGANEITGIITDSTFLYYSHDDITTGANNKIGRVKLDGTSLESTWLAPGSIADNITTDGTYIYWVTATNGETAQ